MPSEPKFTPGPWKKSGRNIEASGRGVIARIPLPHQGGVFDCADNAALLLHAPELYEALQAICQYGQNLSAATQQTPINLIWAGNRALAKCRGESPDA